MKTELSPAVVEFPFLPTPKDQEVAKKVVELLASIDDKWKEKAEIWHQALKDHSYQGRMIFKFGNGGSPPR